MTGGGAELSPCGLYRYHLWRGPTDKDKLIFLMLNPSTADASFNDPTIRKCMGFARAWGFPSISVVNLFAFRSTDPAGLLAAEDPIGPENDRYIDAVLRLPQSRVVFAWGDAGGTKLNKLRAQRVKKLREIIVGRNLSPLCLGTTMHGNPRHPLMLSYESELKGWEAA